MTDIFRRAGGYVDRILKGANPDELPMRWPDRFTMAGNLGTAKALGLATSATRLARTDEVID